MNLFERAMADNARPHAELFTLAIQSAKTVVARIALLAFAVATATLFAGCTILPVYEPADAEAADEAYRRVAAMGLAFAPLQAQRNDQIVQSNWTNAERALAAARQTTCAAGAGYRAAAETATAQARSIASDSAALGVRVQNASSQASTVLNLQTSADQLYDTYINAGIEQARLRSILDTKYYDDGRVIDSARVEDLMRDLDPLVHTYSQAADAAMQIADLAQQAANVPDLEAWEPFGDCCDGITTASGYADYLRTAANNMRDSAMEASQRYSAASLLLPSDRNISVGDLSTWHRDNYREFRAQVNRIVFVCSDRPRQLANIHLLSEWLRDGVYNNLEDFIMASTTTLAGYADQTYSASAEATRNAWLAIRACGGQVPADLPLIESPFTFPTIPSWNSTFWDISSP